MSRRNPAKRKITRNTKFYLYYETWIHLYKKDLVARVTLKKYKIAKQWIQDNYPDLKVKDMDRNAYQDMLNKYGETRELRTVRGLKDLTSRSLKDAYYNGLVKKDPTYSIVVKGLPTKDTGVTKFLNEEDFITLIANLKLRDELSLDWFIYLMIVTGARYQEVLAITPADFDFRKGEVNINKAWDYKAEAEGFTKTKNKASNRKVYVGQEVLNDFKLLLEGKPKEEQLFGGKRVRYFDGSIQKLRWNSTANESLKQFCIEIGIPIVTMHSLRHTYASVLLAADVSMISVSYQLGHASTVTTSKVYAHQTNAMRGKELQRLNQIFKK